MRGRGNRVRKGLYASDHGCYIPHATRNLSGERNRDSYYIKLLNGKVVIVPANFHHYVDPKAHKEYARLMPSLEVTEWAVTRDTLEFLPCDVVSTEQDVERYGFISYVRKNGLLDCGIWDMGRRVSNSYKYPNHAASLVMTQESDANILCKAPVQKAEYSELCDAVSKRFAFQACVYKYEEAFSTIDVTKYNNKKMKLLTTELSAVVKSHEKYKAFSEAFNATVKDYPIGKGHEVDLSLSSDFVFRLSDCERLLVLICVQCRFFDDFEFSGDELVIKFQPCEKVVLEQLEAYRKECASELGYQSPAFQRTPPLPIIEGARDKQRREFDSDDEEQGRSCVLM